jgi:curli biogenesis system outer membrane secretion channel CsgG
MDIKKILIALIASTFLYACGDKKEGSANKKVEPKAEAKPSLPDVGGVEFVKVESSGIGVTPQAAVNEALKAAILQVNGTAISSVSIQDNFGLQVSQSHSAQASGSIDAKVDGKINSTDGNYSVKGKYSESAKASEEYSSNDAVRGQAFAERIVQSSKGNISEFKVISMEGPNSKKGYVAKIEARIAKFKKPADSGKIKIVVAPLKSNNKTFNFAGTPVPSDQVLEPLRQRIIDALSQTGRFSILDRQFGSEMDKEFSLISSGQTPSEEMAKMGQALSADLIWIGVVNNFSYNKISRKLQTSDRELVSFNGGWSISQRLVNVATKQIMQSSTLEGKAPSVAPTTLGASVDKNATLQFMEDDIVKKATEAIILRTFPISVVEIDGDTVVLSQGGKSISVNSLYQIYSLGKEIKDPQTGQSLGRLEKYCCDVLIERVTPTMTYGTLKNKKIDLAGVKPNDLQLRELVKNSKNIVQVETVKSGRSAGTGGAMKNFSEEEQPKKKTTVKENDW